MHFWFLEFWCLSTFSASVTRLQSSSIWVITTWNKLAGLNLPSSFCCPLIIYLYFIFNNLTTRVKKIWGASRPTHTFNSGTALTNITCNTNKSQPWICKNNVIKILIDFLNLIFSCSSGQLFWDFFGGSCVDLIHIKKINNNNNLAEIFNLNLLKSKTFVKAPPLKIFRLPNVIYLPTPLA